MQALNVTGSCLNKTHFLPFAGQATGCVLLWYGINIKAKKKKTFRDKMKRCKPIFCPLWGGFEERGAAVECFNLLLPKGKKKKKTALMSGSELPAGGVALP